MKKHPKVLFLFTALSFVITLSSAYALTLRLNQSKIRLIINPGETKTGVIEVENPTDQNLIVKASLEDWIYSPAGDGTKEFSPPDTTRFSCAGWISFFPAEFVMTPFSKQKLNYTIKAPLQFETGRYAVLFFETSMSKPEMKEGVGMNLVVRIGSIFYMEPGSLTKRQAEIDNLSLKTGTKDKSLDLSLDIKNTGNVDIQTSANFSIMDDKGLVFARGAFNDTFTFPGESVKLLSGWRERLPAGKYDLVITVDLGKALEESGLGRGPVILKESQIEIGENGEVLKTGELK